MNISDELKTLLLKEFNCPVQNIKIDGQAISEIDTEKSLEQPWEILNLAEETIAKLDTDQIEGDIHPAANIEGINHLGEGSRILPGVYIEGNVSIGKNCKIGPNCYIRGNTSVGDNCHIGQSVEIKNSLIMDNTNVGHLSYVGDSILCSEVNLGAGTITSNYRHDESNHTMMIDGKIHDTGRRKFGVIIGQGVHTGINTSFYPGRSLSSQSHTLPNEVVRKNK